MEMGLVAVVVKERGGFAAVKSHHNQLGVTGSAVIKSGLECCTVSKIYHNCGALNYAHGPNFGHLKYSDIIRTYYHYTMRRQKMNQ